MSTGRFTQLDLQRAIKATKAAGLTPSEVRVTAEGEIRVMIAQPRSLTGETPEDVRGELERHFRGWR